MSEIAPPSPSTTTPAAVPTAGPSDGIDDVRARLAARRKGERQAPGGTAAGAEHPGGWLREIRGWTDTLFFAFILALFIRTYVFELFMIPTGSMTPALIGDDARFITEVDWDNDGTQDIVASMPGAPLQVHLRDFEGQFSTQLFLDNAPQATLARFRDPAGKGKGRRDMIMVNKFAYWFSPPQRGDIAIFKTPDRPERGAMHAFDPTRPVYIKRCVGLPGETITVQPPEGYQVNPVGQAGRRTPDAYGGVEEIIASRPLLVNGEPLDSGVFARLHHFPKPNGPRPPGADAEPQVIAVPSDSVLMLGDNQMSSSDGRYWGCVPLSHMRGKAILRYLPWRQFGLLTDRS